MRAIVPAYELNRRVPEQGRIRMGIQVLMKNGKKKPVKLKRFRFTSGDEAAIRCIADLYGGDVTKWADAPVGEQWQVTVTQPKIPIVLPADPLSGTPIYEQWSGGGCVRRCDGVNATLAKADNARPDAEPAIVPCVCRVNDVMTCKPTTRLNVGLNEVRPFGGLWRLETHGWNAAQELPGMVAMVVGAQESGLTIGYLEIQERQAEQGRKKFIVPAVGLPESMNALAAGAMALGALGSATGGRQMPALEAGAADEDEEDVETPSAPSADGTDWYDEDDDIADAEIVDEDPPPPEPPPARRRTNTMPDWLKAMHAAIADLVKIPEVTIDADAFRHGLVGLVSGGTKTSSKELDEKERRTAMDLIADLLAGDRRLLGVTEHGRLRLSQRREDARS